MFLHQLRQKRNMTLERVDLNWHVYGGMWYTTICVHIHWGWIVFLVVMVGLTGAFLLLVVVENRDVEGDRLWKSSLLATVFCESRYGILDRSGEK